MKNFYQKKIKGKTHTKWMVSFALIVVFGLTSNAQSWTVYDASVLPADAGFDPNSSNTSNGTEIMSVIEDTENEGNKLLSYESGVEDKFTWKAPKFSSDYVAGSGFTIMMRAKAISDTIKGVIEFELKNGEVREKLRIHTNSSINFEKSGKLDVDFPEGIDALDFCIYRIVFDGGQAKVWMNETYMGEGLVSETSNSDDPRFVIGDSNGSSDYTSIVDWIIWDETGAYAPGEGAAIPDTLIQNELEGEMPVAEWTVYDASVVPSDAGFSVGSSQTSNGTELVEILSVEGNGVLKISSAEEDKNYWQAPALSDMYDNEKGFTVMLRAAAISSEYGRMTEIEMKGTGWREKVRISSDGIINLEKAGLDFDFPSEFKVTGYNLYRITFKGNHTMVWVNDVFVGEGTTEATSTSSERWVFGDSSSGVSYGAYIDWAVWDETTAHTMEMSPALPDSLDLTVTDTVEFDNGGVEPTPEWTVYDASVVPADAGFSAGSSNTNNGTEMMEVVEDSVNMGNKLLNIVSATEDKFYWSAPKFSDDFVPGEGFTVIMRAKGISADYDKVTEIEMKGGDVREKLRIQTNDIVNFEKSDKMDVAFPEGISALDYCIYRVTFKDSMATLWINEVFAGEGKVSTTSTTDKRWVFGDSNGSSSYGALIDWAIWDETGAYAPGEGAAIPDSLVQTELEDPVEPAWTVYDASVVPADAGFSPGSSQTDNGTELLEVQDDPDNPGNKLLSMMSEKEDKFYWSAPKFSDDFAPGEGFTVIMRAKGTSADYDKVTEIEMKGGDFREKLRIQTDDIVNFEKSDKMDVAFPEGIRALDFCIYRVTFEGGKAKLWINEVFAGEGKISTTSTTDKRWVFGDSNGSSSYAALIDWAIWDETGAYAPGEGAAIPDSLVQTELEDPVVAEWTIYDASVLPADAGFDVGSSQTANGTELLEILTVEGNGILKISSEKEDKNYWQAPKLSDMYDNEKGFTVMLRSAAISEEFGRMTEVEMKGTGWREKVRISSDGTVNLEKAGLDFDFPSEFVATGYNVYRITFKGNHVMVWVNDVFVGEGTTETTSTSSERWVFGDSSSGVSYGAYIDWAIWDETMAHNGAKSPAIPEGLDGSFTDKVDIPTSVNDVSVSNELLVYPNPASDHIYVKGVDISVLEVYNLYGQQVISERNSNKLSLENLTSGVYLVKSTNSKGEVSLGQFVKK